MRNSSIDASALMLSTQCLVHASPCRCSVQCSLSPACCPKWRAASCPRHPGRVDHEARRAPYAMASRQRRIPGPRTGRALATRPRRVCRTPARSRGAIDYVRCATTRFDPCLALAAAADLQHAVTFVMLCSLLFGLMPGRANPGDHDPRAAISPGRRQLLKAIASTVLARRSSDLTPRRHWPSTSAAGGGRSEI